MARVTLQQIQDGIEAALKANGNLWGAAGALKTIKPYEGEPEEYLTGRRDYVPNTPAALIGFSDGDLDETPSNYSFAHTVRFSVLLISGDLRGGKNRKADLFGFFEEVLDTLGGKRLSLDIRPIAPTGWEVAFEGRSHTGLELRFETITDFEIDYESV